MNNAKDEGNRKGKRRASAAAQEQQQEEEEQGSRSRPLSGRLKQRTLCAPNLPSPDEQLH